MALLSAAFCLLSLPSASDSCDLLVALTSLFLSFLSTVCFESCLDLLCFALKLLYSFFSSLVISFGRFPLKWSGKHSSNFKEPSLLSFNLFSNSFSSILDVRPVSVSLLPSVLSLFLVSLFFISLFIGVFEALGISLDVT